MSNNEGKVWVSLVNVINNMESPKKVEVNDEFGTTYQYAPLEEVIRVVKRGLDKESMSYIQIPEISYEKYDNGFESGVAKITTKVFDKSGNLIEFPPVIFKANGNTPQAIGSAMTYARRYSLNSVFGISAESDDDGNASSLNGLNTGGQSSVPVNPNKVDVQPKNTVNVKEQLTEEQHIQNVLSDEQRQELLGLANQFAEMKEVTVDGVLGAFGGIDVLTGDQFESVKGKLIGWIEKANKEQEEEASKKEDASIKGQANFTLVSKEVKKTKEGTDFFEIIVEGAKTPMIAKIEVAEKLEDGQQFVGSYSQVGNKVFLNEVVI